jgi:hypothetical protein
VAVALLAALLALSSCALYEDLVLDNKDVPVPCDQLPSEAEVEQTLADHAEVVERIRDVNPGQVFVDIDTLTCPGRASIAFSYASHDDRVEIERIIAGDTFFGVPYSLRNQ